MSCVVELLRSWSQPRALALAVIAMGAAACSAESTRFTDNPFASKPQGDATGSVPSAQPAPVARVETSQLPAPSATSLPTAVASTTGIADHAGQWPHRECRHPPRPAARDPAL